MGTRFLSDLSKKFSQSAGWRWFVASAQFLRGLSLGVIAESNSPVDRHEG